jgi:membrane fusion protein (multidrug efflux system)
MAGPAGEVGILEDLPVKVGEYIREGATVATTVDINAVKVRVDVPERDVRFLSVGQPVTILGDNVPPAGLTGDIIYISSVADPRTRAFRIEVRVANLDHRLRGQMLVKVDLLRRVLPEAMMIPLDSVIPLEKGYEVYVIENGQAQRRRVNLGVIKRQMVQALPMDEKDPTYVPGEKSLRAGDKLIIKGQRLVGDGQAVVVQRDVTAAPPAAAAAITVPEVP